MGYRDTFIEIAPDCDAREGALPPVRGGAPSVAFIEYELISSAPYEHTEEDVQYEVHVRRAQAEGTTALSRDEFFSRSHACMRASALTKRFGWGVHYDADGRMALVSVGDARYAQLAGDPALAHTRGMRSKRANS